MAIFSAVGYLRIKVKTQKPENLYNENVLKINQNMHKKLKTKMHFSTLFRHYYKFSKNLLFML